MVVNNNMKDTFELNKIVKTEVTIDYEELFKLIYSDLLNDYTEEELNSCEFNLIDEIQDNISYYLSAYMDYG